MNDRKAKAVKVITCDGCGQTFMGSYAAKSHVCGKTPGISSRDDALKSIRKGRRVV